MTQIDQLRALDACAVSDALDRLGRPGVIDGIRPLTNRVRIAGRAITVQLGDAVAEGTSPRHLCTSAIEAAGPADVILVAHRGRVDCAGWGGNLSRAARARRVPGVIVDGAVRDVDEAFDLSFPVFGRAATPRTARGRVIEIGWNEPVTIAGLSIAPGDLVLADSSGVVVIPTDIAADVLMVAAEIVAHDMLMADLIERGTPVGSVMGRTYEQMLTR